MDQTIRAALSSTLQRILKSDPHISKADAIARVAQTTMDASLAAFDEKAIQAELKSIALRYKRHGVLNPRWLAQRDFIPHFFLINAEPGWLDTVMERSEEVRHRGTSQYFVYGDWDSLLILNGTPAEAQNQLAILKASLPDEPVYFSSSSVHFFYRHHTRDFSTVNMPSARINSIARNFDSAKSSADREALTDASVFLGPVWMSDGASRERVVAFTGVNVSGHKPLSGGDLLKALLLNDVLQQTLVHVFEVDQGRPYHFFIKLACENMAELDEATNAIGTTRIGPIRIEGATVVVASGMDLLPTCREPKLRSVGIRPVVDDIQYLAKDLIGVLGDDAVGAINGFTTELKLVVLRALRRVTADLSAGGWEDRWDPVVRKAVRSFTESVLEETLPGRLTGPVVEAATAVEEAMKNAVRALVERVLDADFSLAQKELRLPTKNLRKLSLGKAATALRTASADKRFAAYATALSPNRLDALDSFVEYRNHWAHGDPPWNSIVDVTEHASLAVTNAMQILRWTANELPLPMDRTSVETVAAKPSIVIAEKPKGRGTGSFLSYSSQDREVAVRIATALRAVGHEVWYDDWEIDSGDSIVERIEDVLAHNDTLLILLSPSSVRSKWVLRELDIALMRQLSGQHIRIIPVFIADCEIPQVLASIHYVDFREDFQAGVIKLMQALSKPVANRME